MGPSSALIYNDAFPILSLSWNQAFSCLQGYLYKVNQNASDPPTPANGGKVDMTESLNIPASDIRTGSNWFHIVPLDAMSAYGTVENTFLVTINRTPPSVSSSSHPSSGTWYPSGDVFFNWTFPSEDKNFKGIYYVLDHYGDTMPTSMGTMIPTTQKMLLRAGLANGLWVMHMVPIDQHDYLTTRGSHFRVQVGPNPGTGTILGREIRATSADGLLADIKMDSVVKDGTTTVNLTLK